MDNSLVGQMQSAWGLFTFGSTRLNMPSTKQVVLPEPLCAWAIKSLYGEVKIIGRLIAWILLGFWNFISTYNPFNSSGDRFKSSNVAADVYGVSPDVTYIKLNHKLTNNLNKSRRPVSTSIPNSVMGIKTKEDKTIVHWNSSLRIPLYNKNYATYFSLFSIY